MVRGAQCREAGIRVSAGRQASESVPGAQSLTRMCGQYEIWEMRDSDGPVDSDGPGGPAARLRAPVGGLHRDCRVFILILNPKQWWEGSSVCRVFILMKRG